MNKKYYTSDSKHPEDIIFEVKKFINELQNVQEMYFSRLVKDLDLNESGAEYLFDFIYNQIESYEDFEHYLDFFNKKYEECTNKSVQTI